MKYTLQSLLLLLFLVKSPLLAQNGLGDFKKEVIREGNNITLATTEATVRVEFCTASIVRIRTSWDGNFEPNEPWMVVQYDWPKVDIQKRDDAQSLRYTTSGLSLVVHKSPFALQIEDQDGKVLSTEMLPDETTGGGFMTSSTVGSKKRLFADEHFFGFGERMDVLDRRGKKLRLNVGRGQGRPHIIGAYNVLEANYCPIPFFMSTRGYGIYFHTAYPTEWDMGHNASDSFNMMADGGELDYYIIKGPDFPTILDRYTDLTGKSPLLPKFALGLHLGTYSGGTWGHEEKTSGAYVVGLAQKFRELDIPLDVLHLDSTWRIFGENGGKGATSFEWRETFTDPKAMFDSLYALNLNMVGLHLRPRFDNGKTMRLLDEARAKGFVYPEKDNPGEFVNFFDDEAVDWWWQNGVKLMADQGAMFLKTDEGSAFGHKANESEKTGPTGEEIQSLHNLFPLAYAKAPFEKFQEYNGIRGMNHTREGYAGIQRYPFIFAGDWPSEWQYFEPVIKAGLNIGLSGVGYWAHCMGGFEHVADPELYIRWTQFGLLSPVAHLFGMEHPNYKEPWRYGDEALAIFKKYDRLRYSLLPYLYSAAYEQYKTGKPLMRALVLDHQNDPNTYDITDQYMLGPNLMVCPVTTKGAQTRVIYFPEGQWVNYWTQEIYEGRQFVNVVSPLDQMPMFIKAGSIIPSQEPVEFVTGETTKDITLDIYPAGRSVFVLYDDDGKSLDYAQGTYALTEIQTIENQEAITVGITERSERYKLQGRSYALNIHLSEKPRSIFKNGKDVSGKSTFTDGLLFIPSVRPGDALTINK